MNRSGALYLALAVLMYGGWGVLTKIASVKLHWGTTQLLNVIGSILIVLVFCVPAGVAFHFERPYLVGTVAGVLVALGNITYFKALETTPVSVAYPILALNLLAPVLAGVLFLGEPVTWTKALGVLFALAAVVLLGV
jgi:transporter family protein